MMNAFTVFILILAFGPIIYFGYGAWRQDKNRWSAPIAIIAVIVVIVVLANLGLDAGSEGWSHR